MRSFSSSVHTFNLRIRATELTSSLPRERATRRFIANLVTKNEKPSDRLMPAINAGATLHLNDKKTVKNAKNEKTRVSAPSTTDGRYIGFMVKLLTDNLYIILAMIAEYVIKLL